MIRARLVLAVVTLAVTALTLPGVTAAHAARSRPPLQFSAPALIDHAGTRGRSLQALACPSATLCIAADQTGSVVTSTDPVDPSATWTVSRVDDAGGLSQEQDNSIVALTCASVKLCLGVDGDGGAVLSSTRPTGGTRAWHRTQLPGHPQLIAVACPTGRLCLAADFGGDIDVSTHPTGPAKDWTHTTFPRTGPELSSLTCPTAHLCLAGGTDGAVWVSTDPARGGRSFHRVVIDPTADASIADVACSSTSRCVAVDDQGGVLQTTAPTGAAGGWTRTELAPGTGGAASSGLAAVTCRPSGLCLVVDPGGDVWASAAAGSPFAQVAMSPNASTPAGGAQQSYAALACPSQTQCLAVGGSGDALRSTTPTIAGSWSAAVVLTTAGEPLTAVSCPATSLCVAIDPAGDVLSSTTPSQAASWHSVAADPGNGLAAIDCPTTAFCAIADDAGNVLTTSDPTGPASAWTPQLVAGPLQTGGGTYPVNLTGIACASAQLCITGDEDPGEILTSTDPTGPASAWSARTGIGDRYGDDGLNGASCSSARFCVTISGEAIHASTNPTGNAATRVMVRDSLDAVSCTSRSFCAAVQGEGSVYHGGDVWSSTDPAAAHPRWRRVAKDPREQLGISCVATRLCLAVDAGGRALVSTAPAARRPHWTSLDPDGLVSLTGVSCPSASECVAVDAFGRVLVARR